MKNLSFIILLIFILLFDISANEIVKDSNGNYFLIKSDGTYEKLPKPKPGNKYIFSLVLTDVKGLTINCW